jgi:hypothetical protein
MEAPPKSNGERDILGHAVYGMQGGRGSNPSAPLSISAGQTVLSPSITGLTVRRLAYPVTALLYPDAGHLAGGLTVYLHSVTDDALTTSGGTQAAPGRRARSADR